MMRPSGPNIQASWVPGLDDIVVWLAKGDMEGRSIPHLFQTSILSVVKTA
jgi:hypothetical protein